MPGGRPRDPERAFSRNLFSEWSDRTFARYWRAYRIILDLGDPSRAELAAIIAKCERPNKSFNVAELERQANRILIEYVQREQ